MALQTRVRMILQYDSGSLLYCDGDDNIVFHIESSAGTPVLEQDKENDTEGLCKSYLRQHLIKNDRPSSDLVRLFRAEGIAPLLQETVKLHVEKSCSVEEVVNSIYKTLGVLVSTLQQRTKASIVLAQMQPKSEQDDEEGAEKSEDRGVSQVETRSCR